MTRIMLLPSGLDTSMLARRLSMPVVDAPSLWASAAHMPAVKRWWAIPAMYAQVTQLLIKELWEHIGDSDNALLTLPKPGIQLVPDGRALPMVGIISPSVPLLSLHLQSVRSSTNIPGLKCVPALVDLPLQYAAYLTKMTALQPEFYPVDDDLELVSICSSFFTKEESCSS